MAHRLSNPLASPRTLTQSVLQIAEMLGLYRAELARLLGLQCGDMGELAGGRDLAAGTSAWHQAVLLVRLYEALRCCSRSDDVAMYHWLRVDNAVLGGTPLLLMVDEGRLQEVVEHLEASAGTA